MPDDLATRFLARLDRALDDDRVFNSLDAVESALQEFGWTEGDIFGVLRILGAEEFHLSEPSIAPEGGMIWVFLPLLPEGRIWVRLCERADILVVSFHRG